MARVDYYDTSDRDYIIKPFLIWLMLAMGIFLFGLWFYSRTQNNSPQVVPADVPTAVSENAAASPTNFN